MRNILADLEAAGRAETIRSLVSNFFRLQGPVDSDNLDVRRARVLLEEFRDVVGNDPIEAAIEEQHREKARQAHRQSVESLQAQAGRLTELNRRFLTLAAGSAMTPHQRGFALEDLFFDLLQFSEFELRRPYRTIGREQIDGHFKFHNFDYLVEVKWIAGEAKQEHLSVFDGKIRGKAQSTRGFFLAAEGFDPIAVAKFSGDFPRIVLMTGEDLALVLNGTTTFYDAMAAKVDAIVRHGMINFPVRSMS